MNIFSSNAFRHQMALLVLILWTTLPSHAQQEPVAIYLTWKTDPTSTIVIDWHILHEETIDSIVHFRPKGTQEWQQTTARMFPFPHSDRKIFRTQLTGLQPKTQYDFKVGGYERTYYFETMPRRIDQEPFMFAMGGDTYDRGHEARQIWMERTNRMVREYDPKFILWGGDLAYADGLPDQVWRWYGWYEAIKKTLIHQDGKVIPIISTIGNHEVNGRARKEANYKQDDETRLLAAPFFYSLLAFPGQPGYNVLDFGDYLSLILLDSDHTNAVPGIQTQWLKRTLKKRKKTPHVFPAYHVPAYPSVKPYNQRTSQEVRAHWTPLFDKYKIRMVFEFHDHVFKRTPPIKGEKVDPEGTYYIGDGGWGTQLKAPKDADTLWYIDKIIRERHAVLVSLHKGERFLKTINENGIVIDEFPALFPRPAKKNRISGLMANGGISISAEYIEKSENVHIDSDVAGYTNGGFAWLDTKEKPATITWKIPVAQAENYAMRLRYLNQGESPFPVEMWVNGERVEEALLFEPERRKGEWAYSALVGIYLEEGNNTIELRASQKEQSIKIDKLEVHPAVY